MVTCYRQTEQFSIDLKILVSMGTVVRRRRATETLCYLLNIEVNKGKLMSHSSKFGKGTLARKPLDFEKRPLVFTVEVIY